AHWAAPAIAIGAATVAASPLSCCRRQPVHQVLGPGAHPSHAAELVDVVVHACGVDPDVDMATGPAACARSLCLQDLTYAFELRPGLRRVLQDRTDRLARPGRVGLHRP